MVTSTVFERGSLVPSAKMLTFYRSEGFTVKAEYTQDSDIPSTADRSIGEWGAPSGMRGRVRVRVRAVSCASG